MKKSVKCAVTAALLLLLCAVGIYGIFFAPRKIGCAVDDSFAWKVEFAVGLNEASFLAMPEARSAKDNTRPG